MTLAAPLPWDPLSVLARLAFVFLFLAPVYAAETKLPTIRIDRKPVTVAYETFPANRPPAHLTNNPAREAAFCDSRFTCVCEVRTITREARGTSSGATITHLTLAIGLEITIWTPKGGPRSYLEHEETHRAISEHYYHNAAGIGRRVAQRVLSVPRALPPRKRQSALDRELNSLQQGIISAYMAETHARAAYAQDRFDAITQHGRARIANKIAMQQAIAEEEAHWRSLPARPNPR